MPGFAVLDELVVLQFWCLEAHRGDVDAGDLELGGRARSVIGRAAIGAGDVVGEHGGLLPQRRHQPVYLASVLGALTDHIDVVVVYRAHVVIDDDRPLDGQACALREADVGPDARRDHQHVAVDRTAVGEHDSRQLAVLVRPHLGGALFEMDGDPDVLHRFPQNRTGDVVQLRVHQCGSGVHDIDSQSPVLQAAGGLEAEQSAADHHRLGPVRSLADHADAVVERAEPEDAVGQCLVVGPQPGHRREERPAAGGQDQVVIASDRAVVGVHETREPVDAHDPHPGAQVDVVLVVPVKAVQKYVALVGFNVLTAGQHIGQQDPVVVAVRFVPEHGDVECL